MNFKFHTVKSLLILPISFFLFTACSEADQVENVAQEDTEVVDESQEVAEGDLDEDEIQRQLQEQMMAQQPQPLNPEDITDEELEMFVDLGLALNALEVDAQDEMIAKVEEMGMSVEKFQELSMMQQQGGGEGISEEDLAQFNEINENLGVINSELQQELMKMIESHEDITMEYYQQMSMTIGQNEELQAKVQEMVNERQN